MSKSKLQIVLRDVKMIKAAESIARFAKMLTVLPAVAVGAVVLFDMIKLIKAK